MIGGDRMVGPFGKFAPLFGPTALGSGDCATTTRQRDVGVGQSLLLASYLCRIGRIILLAAPVDIIYRI